MLCSYVVAILGNIGFSYVTYLHLLKFHFFSLKLRLTLSEANLNQWDGSRAYISDRTPRPNDVESDCDPTLGRSPNCWWYILAHQHHHMQEDQRIIRTKWWKGWISSFFVAHCNIGINKDSFDSSIDFWLLNINATCPMTFSRDFFEEVNDNTNGAIYFVDRFSFKPTRIVNIKLKLHGFLDFLLHHVLYLLDL